MLVHAKATRRASAAFAGVCLCALATPAPGQNLNEILNQLQGMAQSENIKRVQAEWNKLPQSELACVTQKLSDRGDNVQSLVRRGVLPSDARVTEVRSQCTHAVPATSPQDQPSTQAKPTAHAAETPVATQPVPQAAQAEEPKPDVELYELRQTNERLKSGLENSAVQIAQLEKTKAELERAIKDAERARSDVENERGMIEETRVAEKRKFDAALTRLEAEKTDALAKGRAWELFTYIATGGLIALLIILGSVLLAKWRRSTPPQQSKSETTSLEPAAQA
jgi:type IV secretory pathway VirB10-like protein